MKPRNFWSSLISCGRGQSLTAASFPPSQEIPSDDMTWPRHLMQSLKKWHFFGLNFSPAFLRQLNTPFNRSKCSSGDLSRWQCHPSTRRHRWDANHSGLLASAFGKSLGHFLAQTALCCTQRTLGGRLRMQCTSWKILPSQPASSHSLSQENWKLSLQPRHQVFRQDGASKMSLWWYFHSFFSGQYRNEAPHSPCAPEPHCMNKGC